MRAIESSHTEYIELFYATNNRIAFIFPNISHIIASIQQKENANTYFSTKQNYRISVTFLHVISKEFEQLKETGSTV